MGSLHPITGADTLFRGAGDASEEGYMKAMMRFVCAAAAAAILSVTVVSCGGGGTTAQASGPSEVKYKCACGKEKMGPAAAAPS